MPERIAGLSQVIEDYDALLVDLWGCVHNGVAPFPAAVDAMRRAIAAGRKVCLLSNGPRRVEPIVKRLDEMGVPRDCYEHVVTSGEAAWRAIAEPADDFHRNLGRRVFHLGPPRDASVYEATSAEPVARVEDADFIVNTGVHDNGDTVADYEPDLAAGAARKLPMVCANPDLLVHIGDVTAICAGLTAARYEELGGKVSYHGKPFPSVYAMCFGLLGDPDPARVLGIGDAIRTDVAGAKGVGAAALFLTGGIYRDDFGTDDPAPDAVAAQAAKEGHPAPDFVMPYFAW